jgi:hypothetical protein
MQTTCYAGFKSNKNTVQNRLGNLAYTYHKADISCYIPVIAWYILSCTSYILNRFFLTIGEVSGAGIWMDAHPEHIAWFSGVGIR